MARKHRTFDEKETDRNNIITVLLQAKDWVRPGWVSKRIMTSSKNLVNHDLVTMVAGGTLQRTTKPFRYAITGKFQRNQFIKDLPKKPSCIGCGTTKTSQWRVKGTTCNICYCRERREAKKANNIAPQDVDLLDDSKYDDNIKPPFDWYEASKTSHANKGWSDAEIKVLISEVRQQLSVLEIARKHGRTVKAISSRIYKLIAEGKIDNHGGKSVINHNPPSRVNREVRGNTLLDGVSELVERSEKYSALQAAVVKFLQGNLTLAELKEASE
tara:strand:- start:34 stop:846 length:813 start_codon:yes stop_codon:yes gene_type:complete